MKPVCMKCHRFYRPKKNGFIFIEGMPVKDRAAPGLQDSDLWKPYKLWQGDLWVCHGCGAEIIVGVAGVPLGEHYEPDFTGKIERFGADFQVNDC